MEASAFWRIIGEYNTATAIAQAVLLLLLLSSIILSFRLKKGWICKIALAALNLFIAIAFFATFGTEPIQKYFALPLYIGTALLFAYDAWKSRDEQLNRPTAIQWCFFLLYLVYPLVSVACGHTYPQIVTHIMPCPVVTISIALYAGYKKRNPLLLALLVIWGLTGVKAIIFSAYEDLILLAAGIYGIVLLVRTLKQLRQNG